jgi:GNAT superfamily N-acetyltransferase
MMNVEALSFEETRRKAEARLSGALGGACNVVVCHALTTDLLGAIEEIESRRFRRELRYTREELSSRSRKGGFTCLMVYLDGEAVAFDFGYDDAEEGAFFSDSAAALIERRGIGAALTALEALYCFEAGYRSVKMITEEEDESGRRLREYWERFGFRVTGVDPSVGVEMRLDLWPEAVRDLCERYIGAT